MNPSDKNADPLGTELTEEDRLRASRRAAILSGLGKGSAALVAMSPLASHATRTHKIGNMALPGGFGYCSISGFQSAAVSGTPPPTTCSAYAPARFLASGTLTYTGGNLGISGAVNANKLRDALNAKYSVSVFTSTNVAPLLSSTQPSPAYVAVGGSGVVLIWASSNTSTALTRNNWPSFTLDSLTAFNAPSLFSTSTDARPLLLVLRDGVISANPSTANCWFLSAYLTVFNSTPANLPAGFDKPYLTSNYVSAGSGNAYAFLKALCTVT